MFRIDSDGSVIAADTPSALGTEGHFSAGDPAVPRQATQVTATWLEAVQESLVSILTMAGVAHSKTDYTKVLQAILAMATLTDTGAVNVLRAAPPVALPAYASIPDGTVVVVVPNHTTTSTTPTFGVSGGADTTIVNPDGSALAVGQLVIGWPAALMKKGANWLLLWTKPTAPGGIPSGYQLAHGECYLTSPTNVTLKLSPQNGCNVISGGTQYQLASSGITLTGNNSTATINGVANQNIQASKTYLVSFDGSAGALKLWDAASYAHAPDTTAGDIGVEVITSAGSPVAGQTLVGLAWADASSHFSAVTTISWFQRKRRIYHGPSIAPTTASGSFVVLAGSAQDFVCWGDTATEITMEGSVSNDTAATFTTWATGLDGVSFGGNSAMYGTGSGQSQNAQLNNSGVFAEGHHVASAVGEVSSGTATWSIGIEIRFEG